MAFWQLLIIGAIAGLTIYLGLPFAVMKNIKPDTKTSFTGLATGILLFLGIEVVSKVLEVGDGAIEGIVASTMPVAHGVLLLVLVAAGITTGLVGIPLVEKLIIQPASARGRERNASIPPAPNGGSGGAAASATRPTAGPTTGALSTSPAPIGAENATRTATLTASSASGPNEANARVVSLSIAAGIGLHNLGEGLAIGQSAATGAISLALLLVIGFGLHNMTEGFGVAAPLSGTKVSPTFVFLAGLLAGGPTFVGTLIGSVWTSDVANAIFLSIAGGSLVYVTAELFSHSRKSINKIRLMGMITLGFLIAYGTDLVVSAAGA